MREEVKLGVIKVYGTIGVAGAVDQGLGGKDNETH